MLIFSNNINVILNWIKSEGFFIRNILYNFILGQFLKTQKSE